MVKWYNINMKIAVYTITKNEEKHIRRWAESAQDADFIFILDTGSQDDTIDEAVDAGAFVQEAVVSPWRFDDARNIALSMLPEDVDMCISLDADEVLVEGWRKHLEAIPQETTRPRYQYTWSWNEDGTPDLIYGGDKIHSRHGYRWRYPVHEVLTPYIEEVQNWCNLEIHHFPDSTKSRSNYFPLLVLGAQENPDCDRTAHYLAREYFFHGQMESAAEEFKRHLSLPSARWPAERARSMQYLAKCEPHKAERWLMRALGEDPNRREVWVDLAEHYYNQGDWWSAYSIAIKAARISKRNLDYLSESRAWGSLPYDIAAFCAFKLGRKEEALAYGKIALQLEPNNDRLKKNLEWYAT